MTGAAVAGVGCLAGRLRRRWAAGVVSAALVAGGLAVPAGPVQGFEQPAGFGGFEGSMQPGGSDGEDSDGEQTDGEQTDGEQTDGENSDDELRRI